MAELQVRTSPGHPEVTGFFEPVTSSISYVVADPESGRAAVIDPVLDYDVRSARISTQFAGALAAFVGERRLKVDWVLDTHVHADHVTAISVLGERLGAPTGIGARVPQVQRMFHDIYNLDAGFRCDGSQFDRLFADGETFAVGGLSVRVLHTPGHTPACVSYRIGDALFVGDVMFMPDSGTARCDFPGGSAHVLYGSIRRLLALPAETRVFVGHDYGAEGRREHCWETTVGEQRRANVHAHDGVGEADYVTMRTARDATLALPALMLPAIQMNLRGGRLPPPEENGVSYLKIPLNRF